MSPPRWLDILRLRLRSLLRHDKLDAELDEELAYHVEQEIARLTAAGRSPERARTEALRSLGGLTQQRERCRDERRIGWLEDFVRDVGYAARGLRRDRGFAIVAVTALALGIGANTATFTVVNGVLLRPLPFAEPERLFLLSSSHGGQTPFGPILGLGEQQYLNMRAGSRLFEGVASFSTMQTNLISPGEPTVVATGLVTTEFFRILGVPPAIGRGFEPGDEGPAGDEIVVLSDAVWRSRFGSNPAAVGSTVMLDGEPRRIVGVMPPGFGFPTHVAIWVPQTIRVDPRNTFIQPVVGRLAPWATSAQAQAELLALAGPPDGDASTWRVEVRPLKDYVVGNVRTTLAIFAAAVGLVLLIACVNVANLLLARSSARRREVMLRTALGAGRVRLVRQLLAEGALLAFLGTTAGVLLAWWSLPLLVSLAPPGALPRAEAIQVDATVLAFGVLAATITTLVFGLPPALHATSRQASLGAGSRGATRGGDSIRHVLIGIEVALAIVLLAGAGLLLKSLVRLHDVDAGFQADRVLTFTVDLPPQRYPTVEQMHAFHDAMLARLAVLPGVERAGAVNWLPFGSALISGDVLAEGRPAPADDYGVDKLAVSKAYFDAMGIRVIDGRDFTPADRPGALPVAIVSRHVAGDLWPGEHAVGKRISVVDDPRPEDWLTVVGVVEDVKQQDLRAEARRTVYQPYHQVARPFFVGHMSFVVRTAGSPAEMAPLVRDAAKAVDANQPLQALTPMDSLLGATTAATRFQTRLLGLFAAVALTLTAAGIYGVTAYLVTRRTREFAIRAALGAPRRTIIGLALRRTLIVAGVGILAGLAAALALSTLIADLLFEIQPSDPGTLAAVAGLVMLVVAATSLTSAARAVVIDPMAALQVE
jgi:predicted permease